MEKSEQRPAPETRAQTTEVPEIAAAREAVLDRLVWQLEELRASLDRLAVAQAAMAAELVAPQGVIS